MAVGPQRHRDYMGRIGHADADSGWSCRRWRGPWRRDAQHWREINTMTIGFGHGISVTPLHVVNGVATLANGGVLRQPTLVAQAARHGARGRRG